ncbi:putative metalloprotease CJM1_0395 family protein [Roseibium sp. FZY0029]|uniref:putative metalloprotease CJM1_0395 family protein n=1 Tax=Roseibium sp. FZY0029 TaxID=3116647 RepID=UPI002EBB6F2C|nr:putative metalloprotease CJM1_0395 family protein [Roseibium sp. FZY0029]
MIGAILSNTPATILRGSGVAAERDPGSGENTPGRDQASARASQASAQAIAARSGNTPILTAQAVIALQEADGSADAPGRSRQAPASNTSESEDAETGSSANAAPAGADAEAEAAGNNASQAQDEGAKDEDPDGDGLDQAEEKQVDKLKQRDQEVRAHEQAHARVGGAHAGAPSYTFQQGPDGKRYAIGGEVQIDTSKERTPEATIRKMQIVIRAATAPADPSSQDLKVAQQARAQISEAQAEVRQKKTEELSGDDGDGDVDAATGPDRDLAGPDDAKGAESTDGAASDRGDEGSGGAGGDRTNAETAAAISAYQSAVQRTNEIQSRLFGLNS